MSAVMRAVSDAIFRHQLEGFDKYPRNRDERFLEVFNEHLVSVDHARAVADSFREKMPNIQEIIDTALNLRPRFEIGTSQREQWEREYGPPQPFDLPSDFKTPRGTAFAPRGREIDRLWQEVMAFLRSTQYDGRGPRGDIQHIHWGRCWQIARALGYEMNGAQLAEIAAFEHANPKSRESLPVKKSPITGADFKALAAGKEDEDASRWG